MLTSQQRSDFARAERDLDAVTVHRLVELLGVGDVTAPKEFSSLVFDTTPALVGELADVSALIGAEAYDLSRQQSDARGRFAADLSDPPDAEQVHGSVRDALFPLFFPGDGVTAAALAAVIGARLAGSMQRLVREGNRRTIVDNAQRDPAKPMFMRVVRAGGCDFCRDLAARGPMHPRRDGSTGKACHDHCHCRFEQLYPGEIA